MNAHTPFRWSLDWKSALFTALLLPVLVSLGFWQLHRADEKRAIQAQYTALAAAEPVALDGTGTPVNYQPVRLQGQFDTARFFLLDNRMRDGRVGYEVIGLFRTDAGKPWIAVNRGWVAGSPDRRQLPAVSFSPDTVTLQGHVYWPEAGWRPSGPAVTGDHWPRVTQSPLPQELAAALGEPLAPYLVRLSADSPAAFVTDWQPINTQPEKHTAYAVQWFLMAFALLALFVYRNSNLASRRRVPTEVPHDA